MTTNDTKLDSRPEAPPDTSPAAEGDDQNSLTLFQMFASALAAGFGVQSSANRKRDFTKGKASQFIIIGVVFTALFVVVMVLLVRLIMSLTTGQ